MTRVNANNFGLVIAFPHEIFYTRSRQFLTIIVIWISGINKSKILFVNFSKKKK